MHMLQCAKVSGVAAARCRFCSCVCPRSHIFALESDEKPRDLNTAACFLSSFRTEVSFNKNRPSGSAKQPLLVARRRPSAIRG
jgi:hypothetical protein